MMASGWLARTLGHGDEAVALMEDAARTEESSETHDTLSPGTPDRMLHPRAREAGLFGAQDGRASINFRVLYQLITA